MATYQRQSMGASMIRKQYRASIKVEESSLEQGNESRNEAVNQAVQQDQEYIQEMVRQERCHMVALYQHERMLFLYYETEETLEPKELFPNLSSLLELWPQREGKTPWAYMYPIFYHSEAKDNKEWIRKEKKVRRGRIAYLLPEKLFSYVYYHKALVEEGLLEGDQYQYISLHEDILFSYFEEPKKFTHIKKDSKQESKVIQDWLAVEPESHFDHTLSGQENFLLIEEIFSMGREDIV